MMDLSSVERAQPDLTLQREGRHRKVYMDNMVRYIT